jgi:8-oxo-dGTP pyrophosphatase MutT (NUDIX family)
MEQVTLRDSWGNLAVTLSCKAVVQEDGMIWLRQNERKDWELPGGRLDEVEQPEDTIIRELREELGVEVGTPHLIDVCIWKKDFGTNTHIGIVTFCCDVMSSTGIFEDVGEAGAAQFKQFTIGEALLLPNLPDIYKRALKKV